MFNVTISKNGSINFTVPFLGFAGEVYVNPNVRLFNDSYNVWFLEINGNLVYRLRNTDELISFLQGTAFYYAAA